MTLRLLYNLCTQTLRHVSREIFVLVTDIDIDKIGRCLGNDRLFLVQHCGLYTIVSVV